MKQRATSKTPDSASIPLPTPAAWGTEEDVAAYARVCLDHLGLADWGFRWDKTIRRMGCCKAAHKQISLSIYFVQKFLQDSPGQVRRTLLHELAHALAWEFNMSHGHGPTWHAFCAKLGIADEKARTACADFAPPEKKRKRVPLYVLFHKETGEVYHHYTVKPRKAMRRIKHMYIAGKKAETLGKLGIRPYSGEG